MCSPVGKNMQCFCKLKSDQCSTHDVYVVCAQYDIYYIGPYCDATQLYFLRIDCIYVYLFLAWANSMNISYLSMFT